MMIYKRKNYYKRRGTEKKQLAELYATAWHRLYFWRSEKNNAFRNENEHQKILSGWATIEEHLYKDIRNIMDSEEFYYPPCVIVKINDPFYRIKPFMTQNGWTDSITRKIWVKAR